MNVEILIVGLRIEEDNKGCDKRVVYQHEVKANVVDNGQSYKAKKKHKLGPKDWISKKKKKKIREVLQLQRITIKWL